MFKHVQLLLALVFFSVPKTSHAWPSFFKCVSRLKASLGYTQKNLKLFNGASPITLLNTASPDKPFIKETFGASDYGKSSAHNPDERFQNWAVNTAHEALAARREGKGYREIYDQMIEARRSLEIDGGERSIAYRKPSEGGVDHIAWAQKTSEDTAHRNDLYPYVVNIVEARSTHENSYTKQDGEKVKLSYVGHLNMAKIDDPPNTILRTSNTFEDRGESVLQDIAARLETAENSPSLEKKIDEFSRAFYGLASLSPLRKGNSAIARVYMTTAAYRIFGKNISLYPDLTIEAMIRTEDQFLDMMKSNLSSQL